MKRPLIVTSVLAAIFLVAWSPRTVSRSSGLAPVSDSLPSPAGPGSAEPNLAVGPDGRIYLSWLEKVDSAFALRVASLNGRTWTAPRTIRIARDFFVNWADFPSIEALGGGRLAAHWLQRTGSATYAYGVRIAFSRDDGQTWSAPVIPHRDTSNTEHGFVSFWRENSGVGAAWLDGRKFKPTRSLTNEMMVASTTLSIDGATGAEVFLDSRACDCCQTSAAMTAAGPIIAYRDRSPEEIRDIYVVRRVKGKWTEPKAVHNDNWKIPACPVNGPAVEARGDRVALAWFTAANDSPRVKLAFSRDRGATFGSPVRIDEGNPAGRVDVALLPNGDALVTWIERTGGDTAAVRVRRVSRSGRASAPKTVATSSSARASGFPRMAIVGDDVMFAWTVPTNPSSVRVARVSHSDIR